VLNTGNVTGSANGQKISCSDGMQNASDAGGRPRQRCGGEALENAPRDPDYVHDPMRMMTIGLGSVAAHLNRELVLALAQVHHVSVETIWSPLRVADLDDQFPGAPNGPDGAPTATRNGYREAVARTLAAFSSCSSKNGNSLVQPLIRSTRTVRFALASSCVARQR
jgi:hypothetical protein